MSKQLIKQLKSLQEIKLSKENKESNLNFLLSNIQSKQEVEQFDRSILSWSDLQNIFMKFTNPYILVATFLFLVFGGFGLVLSNNATPNNALYFVRVAKENAKLAIVTDEGKKNVLDMKFAGDHARDISNVLNSDNIDKEEVRELSESFNKEIQTVKNGLDKVAHIKDIDIGNDKNVRNIDLDNNLDESNNHSDSDNSIAVLNNTTSTSDSKVKLGKNDEFSVASSDNVKDNGKVEIYVGDNLNQNTTSSSELNLLATTSHNLNLITLEKIASTSDIVSNSVDSKKLNELLSEIKELFDKKEYAEASKKLDYFMNIVDNNEIYVYNYSQDENGTSSSASTTVVNETVSTSSNE